MMLNTFPHPARRTAADRAETIAPTETTVLEVAVQEVAVLMAAVREVAVQGVRSAVAGIKTVVMTSSKVGKVKGPTGEGEVGHPEVKEGKGISLVVEREAVAEENPIT